MKTRLLIVLFCVGFLNHAIGQVRMEEQPQSPQELYNFHMAKKKSNKTMAWITLGGGIAMIAGGLAINLSEGIFTENPKQGLWLTYLGAATSLVSAPLFVAAIKHKKQAEIQLQKGTIGWERPMPYTGLSLVISF